MNNDKPLTQQDIEKEDIGDRHIVPIEKVQSAKRLLRSKIFGKVIEELSIFDIIELIDACFQIGDSLSTESLGKNTNEEHKAPRSKR